MRCMLFTDINGTAINFGAAVLHLPQEYFYKKAG